jgi:hypothetical protein
MRGCSSQSDSPGDSIGAAFFRVLRDPWTLFVVKFNWKAAFLSAAFRGVLFAVVVIPRGAGAARGAWIEIVFRLLLGGCWGSLMQAFRRARPAWLAGALVAIVLPASAHTLEYALLKAGQATHILTGMIVSVICTVGSGLVNFGLMRRGLIITGEGSATLGADFRGLPAALADSVLVAGTGIRRIFRKPA